MVKDTGYIKDKNQLEFAIFCIENVSEALGVDGEKLYDVLAVKNDILQEYIVSNYDILHTQGKEYIVNDILEIMKERGINV